MPQNLIANLDLLVKSGQSQLLGSLQHGIEKEGLRVDAQGAIAQSDHPTALGSTLTHEQITTDYSEALLEFITPVQEDIDALLNHLKELHQFSYEKLGTEELWNASMPCRIASDRDIRIAEYGSSNIGQLKHIYRVGLEYRYGKMMQCIAGIHYNFSLPEAFWPLWRELKQSSLSDKHLASAGYFTLIRNFRRSSWLLLYLFGSSPALGKDFMQGSAHALAELDSETLYLPHATSLRMSDLGYSNRAQKGLNVCFNQLSTYATTLQQAIRTVHPPYKALGVKVDDHYRQLSANVLQIENEYYSDIRPKRVTFSGEKPVHALIDRGVQYIEVRNTDINPLLPLGIDAEQARFMDAYLISCLLGSDNHLSDRECSLLNLNKSTVVKEGRKPGLRLQQLDGETSRETLGTQILDQVELVAQLLDEIHFTQAYTASVATQRARLADPELTPSAQILAQLKSSGVSYQDWALEKSREHRQALAKEPLADARRDELDKMAADSIQSQREQEAQPQEPFDQFLQHYLEN